MNPPLPSLTSCMCVHAARARSPSGEGNSGQTTGTRKRRAHMPKASTLTEHSTHHRRTMAREEKRSQRVVNAVKKRTRSSSVEISTRRPPSSK